MNLYAMLDQQLVKLWRGVLRVLCGLTGRSNFCFARLIIIAGAYWSVRWAAWRLTDWVAVTGFGAISVVIVWLTILLQRDGTEVRVGVQRLLMAFRSSLNITIAIVGFQSIFNPAIRRMVLIMALLDVLAYFVSIPTPPQSSWFTRVGRAARNQVSMSPHSRR